MDSSEGSGSSSAPEDIERGGGRTSSERTPFARTPIISTENLNSRRDSAIQLDGSERTAEALEEFLFSSLASDKETQMRSEHSIDTESGSIFETSFDLTEDRLLRLFKLFDEDHNGTISYEELKLGLTAHETEIGASQLDDRTFLGLIQYLDADKSGDITFDEFSEGVRLLMMRSILRKVARSERNNDLVLTEVFDYNSSCVGRRVLQGIGQVKQAKASFAVLSQSLTNFFLHERGDGVTVRWINITGKKASNIMQMMALKYRLHPLALEDALDSTNQRPRLIRTTGTTLSSFQFST